MIYLIRRKWGTKALTSTSVKHRRIYFLRVHSTVKSHLWKPVMTSTMLRLKSVPAYVLHQIDMFIFWGRVFFKIPSLAGPMKFQENIPHLQCSRARAMLSWVICQGPALTKLRFSYQRNVTASDFTNMTISKKRYDRSWRNSNLIYLWPVNI